MTDWIVHGSTACRHEWTAYNAESCFTGWAHGIVCAKGGIGCPVDHRLDHLIHCAKCGATCIRGER